MLTERIGLVRRSDIVWAILSLAVLMFVGFYLSVYRNLGLAIGTGWKVLAVEDTVAIAGDGVEVGDELRRIGGLTYEEYIHDRTASILDEFDGESAVPLQVVRGSRSWTVRLEGKPREASWRDFEVWFFPVLFWLMGTVAAALLRPRGQRWLVLVLFYYSTALWTVTGFLSTSQHAYSAVIFHGLIWLFMPLSVHLHLILPGPILKSHRAVTGTLYAGSLLMIVLDYLRLVPPAGFVWSVALAVLVSLALLGYRLATSERPAIKLANRLMLFGLILGWGPVAFNSVLLSLFSASSYSVMRQGGAIALWAFVPLWPLSYIYAIYRHDVGALRYRANRFLGAYGFFASYVTAYIVTFNLLAKWLMESSGNLLFSLLASLAFVVAAPSLRQRFQRLVDRRVFGMKYSPSEIVGVFAGRIPAAYNRSDLRRVIVEEILPTLLIRQSALHVFGDLGSEAIYEQNVPAAARRLRADELGNFLVNAGVYIPFADGVVERYEWVRLAMPLTIQDKSVGLWLFGRRDPDDYYPKDDIELLTQLANQIAPVIENFRLVEKAKEEVAENKRLQNQLIHSQKMEAIGRFSAGIAHDFNNLLSVILGYSSILRDKYQDTDLGPGLAEIEVAGERAADLTRQLLAFSRQGESETRVIDVNRVVTDVTKMLSRMTGEDIQLSTRLTPDLANVRIDPGQMSQVFLNLAVNARDAMPEGGQLVIETSSYYSRGDGSPHRLPPGFFVLIQVSDSGSGLPPEIRSHIFEPFFTTKDKGKGTGLGLSMVYGFVQQSRGHVFVDSELGRGTTFSIYLPATDEVAVEVEGPEPDLPVGDLSGSETILLVEDEDSVREITRKILVSHGYTVLQAASGPQGLELSRRHDGGIDLLLTDVIMPRMKGPELAGLLVEERPGLRVLYMSGYNEEAIFDHPNGGSGPVLVQKPFTPQQLATSVRKILDEGAS